MIHYNKSFDNKLTNKVIKHRCKIKSLYYYIQISINEVKPNEKITFLIKCKDNISHSILYKRQFSYNELINYNKQFSYFSSLNNIFINISQSLQENKFTITNSVKCLSLTMEMYIKKKNKYVNINVNLNKHKNLKPLNFSVFKYKNVQRVSLGIQNEKEIRNVLYDIRKRLKKIENNQNILNNTFLNNTNVNNIINDGNIKYKNNNDINMNMNNYKNNIDNNISNYNNNIDMNNYKNDNNNNLYNNNIDINKINFKNIDNNNISNNNDKNSKININNSFIDNNKKNDINNNNLNIDNIINNNGGNINDINKSLNNSNIYKNDYSEVNINKNDKINNLNEPNSNYNPNSILGMSEMMMKKLNDLEKSIYNKDDKIIKLENRLKYLNSQEKKSRNIANSKLNNNKNDSIDNYNYNYNRNKISQFYPNQSTGNLDKSNDISIINKTNEKNVNLYQNISQDPENNNNDPPMKNKYYNYNNSNISDINNISGISDISKNDRRKHKNHSSNNHRKHHKPMNTSENNDTNKYTNIYDNNTRMEENNKAIVKVKSFKRPHSNEKHKHKYKYHKSDNKIYRDYYRNDIYMDKPKNNKKIFNIEKKIRTKSNRDNSYDINESETNNHFSYLFKDTNNNNNNIITEEISRNNINNNINNNNNDDKNDKDDSSYIQILKPKIVINKSNDNNNNSNHNHNNNSKSINNNNTSSINISKISKISKISLYPREEIKKYVNSRIIFRKDELRLLKDKISNNDRKLHVFFDLLYRASENGDKELTVREKIEDYYETLTLFYTQEGARFGVYIKRIEAHSFMKGKNYKEVPGSCFLVGLNNLVIYQIDNNKTSNDHFKDVLCFGRTFYLNKNGSNWMIFTPQNNFLGKKCIIGNGEGLFSNIDIEELVGDKEYHIKDVEIFNVAIERFYLQKE